MNVVEELDNLATYLEDARKRLLDGFQLSSVSLYGTEVDAILVTVQSRLDELQLRLTSRPPTCYLCEGPRGRIDLFCGDCQRKVPDEDQSNAALDLEDNSDGWSDGRGQGC